MDRDRATKKKSVVIISKVAHISHGKFIELKTIEAVLVTDINTNFLANLWEFMLWFIHFGFVSYLYVSPICVVMHI